jgi:hypothetical protein
MLACWFAPRLNTLSGLWVCAAISIACLACETRVSIGARCGASSECPA